MDDKLGALTDQRISVEIAGKKYSIRRATAYDFTLMLRYIEQKGLDKESQAANLEASAYLLCELMKPEVDMTPEDLLRSIPFENFLDLNTAVEKAGFIMPQLPTIK